MMPSGLKARLRMTPTSLPPATFCCICTTLQTLVIHVAPLAAQSRPHVPQCSALLVRAVSQPVSGLPSQSSKPSRQVSTHLPSTHAAAAFIELHLVSQSPQDVTSVRLRSHSVSGSPSHSPFPAGHSGTGSAAPPLPASPVTLGGPPSV